MFEGWLDHTTVRRFTPPRPVTVDMSRALPVTIGSLGARRSPTLRVRANAMRLELHMVGRQIAWAQVFDSQWLAIVEIPVASANKVSRLTMTLWVPAAAITVTDSTRL
ncbi:hypothetical protein GOEFS_051_00040 [Gordonia effusa NBRC 100432]|uniref:Uncharacterized protein n=1 Tax=Gordonia effusa NBRC 100432 TaxID=1077974 RepID=H0QZQ8_9ACTN|nr:hypothetical protein GOEFS_051_00040 [Gordonia effusa NBRC 100432]